MKQIPPYITITLSVFAGGVVGALQATPGVVWYSPATAKAALLGALLAGLVAVIHYYQVPASLAVPPVLAPAVEAAATVAVAEIKATADKLDKAVK